MISQVDYKKGVRVIGRAVSDMIGLDETIDAMATATNQTTSSKSRGGKEPARAKGIH
jgi:hypothetical protein